MESTPRVTVEGDRPLRSRALARMAATGIYLLRGVSHGLQRAARARAVSEGTTLRRVLVQGLHEYAAGTWTPQVEAKGPEAPALARSYPRPAAKFVQICASQNDLFTLDEGGDVHQYNFTAKAWEKLLPARSPDAPERGSRGAREGERPLLP
jgi:hypothetical protein